MATGSDQFLRDCELIIGPKEETDNNAPKEPTFAKRYSGKLVKNPLDPTRFISGFRITFNIDKTTGSDSNKSRISIYNISQESRNFFEEKNLIIFLKAGYEGALSNIFFGDVVERSSSRSGPDIITTLECGDQEKILATANVNIGLDKGATNIQAFEAAALALNLTIPPRQLALIPSIEFNKGFSFTGTAQQLLDEQVSKIKFDWSIQDGEIQILEKDVDDGQLAVLVTPNTGLIDFPTKTQDGLSFRTLLNPEFRIGRACKVESKQFQGVFAAKPGAPASGALTDNGGIVVCKKLVFNGDNLEGPWESQVEGQTPKGTAA